MTDSGPPPLWPFEDQYPVVILGAARVPWTADEFEREADLAALDVEHEPDCLRVRPRVRMEGLRMDGQRVGVLRCGRCGASRTLVEGRPVDAVAEVVRPRVRRTPGRPSWKAQQFWREFPIEHDCFLGIFIQ